jgi:molecular chaperone GrpE
MSAKNTVEENNTQEETKLNEELTQAEANVEETTETEASPVTEEENPLVKIEALEVALSQEKDQKLRLYADFENHKKRTAKERIELFGTANQELMSALLPIVDDFKRALKNVENTEAEEGIKLIYHKFENTLKQKGLKPMENCTGKDLDVDTMEAITRIPAPSEDLKGKVVDEIEQGFFLGNKIIRYARVVVGE